MTIDTLFQIFGQTLVLIAVGLFILLILALILGRILLKKDILIFPKLIIFALDVLFTIKKVS